MRVPWADTDAAQVVYFPNYFKFFEAAERELYAQPGYDLAGLLRSSALWFPRLEAKCTYKSPCRYDDEIEVRLTLLEMRSRAVKYGMTVQNLTTGKLAAEGYVVIASVDPKLMKAVPLPESMVRGLRKYFEETG